MNNHIHLHGKTPKLEVYRERPATRAERKKDKGAKIMAEWVYIQFSENTPKITINRDLCDI